MNNNDTNSETVSGLPQFHFFSEVTSCLDVAFELIKQGRLGIWSSVIAKTQTAGRGQMRRKWISPVGNLYASLRLPASAPFNTSASSGIIASFCASALRACGCNIMIKWPNDLILCDSGVAKVAGILIEERAGAIVAGIGINIRVAPDSKDLDGDGALPAASISRCVEQSQIPKPAEFWIALVKHLYSAYTCGPMFKELWQPLGEDLLLWHKSVVEVTDGNERVRGRLAGLTDKGGAILETQNGIIEKYGGSMRLVHE